VSFDGVLVANRGEIARRIVRAARELGLRSAVVFTEADRHAAVVAEADVAIRLTTSYLDVDAVIDAARRAGVGAVHPGYGYLAENAAAAAAVEAAGLVWVGPSPEVIAQMGDKLAAKTLAAEVGVPMLPSTEDPARAGDLGLPLLVKAAGGGGGKGMRVVRDPLELDAALAAARREAQGAFGDERVFLERYVERSRHVEVQVLGDREGNLVHLGERECSVQRRHQKLIEESPSPALDDDLREALCQSALSLARAMGYYSVGTVEFLLDDLTREFFFLEVNTRLQVEHPVTEEVTGVDLVRAQLRVAQGHRLDLSGPPPRRGWAIEARLCAEDPAAGYLPATGTLAAFEPAPTPAVRLESGVVAGDVVGVDFDPLLAKLIVHAPTREEAARRLAAALEGLHLGGVATNRDLLAATLRHERFLAGDTTTDFLERVAPATTLVLDEGERAWALAAASLWLQGRHRRDDPVWGAAPSGWRNARLPDTRARWRLGEETVEVAYRAQRDGSFRVDGARAVIHAWGEREVDVELEGVRRRALVTWDGQTLYLQVARGTLALQSVARFAPPAPEAREGGLHAPMPGTVTAVRVAAGESVTKGQALVMLEAMKMEHVISAPHDGVVRELLVAAGQQVASGEDLLTLDAPAGS
jgi:propionyl-CoA carboxylase alpha chain